MRVFVVVLIGCLECHSQNASRLIGVYTDEAVARRAREIEADRINSTDADILLFSALLDAGEGRLIQPGIWDPD